MEEPVVQVIDETNNEIVYTLRIQGAEFRPKVFHEGKYTVKVGDQNGRVKKLTGVESFPPDVRKQLRVDF